MLLAVASASGWRSLEGDDEIDAEAATPPGVLSTASDDLTLRARVPRGDVSSNPPTRAESLFGSFLRTAPLQALAKETSLGKAVRRASGRLAGDAATGDAAAERAREGPREALCDDDERAAACESHVNFGDLPKLGDRRVSLTPRSSEAPADDAAPPPAGDATPQLRRYAAWRSRALRRARRHSLRESLPAGANYAAARRRAGVPRKNVPTRVSATGPDERSRPDSRDTFA